MSPFRKRLIGLFGCGLVGLVFCQVFPPEGIGSGFESLPGGASASPMAAPGAPASGRFLGAGSCASAGCHGGNGSHGVERSEYSIWIERDRHANAYSVLFGIKSQQIARNLNIPAAEKEASCLACHALEAPAEKRVISHDVLLSDGVSCEACHGAAENWLQAHVLPSWKRLSPISKSATGFISGRHDLLRRTEQCADCHVGGPGRDVNHDLIAAGHPRLNFESAAFFAKMPRHWVGRLDEARLWAVGRVVTAEKSLELLSARAARAPAWPEFAEYECFACHHDLQAGGVRQPRGKGSKPGQLVWNTWNVSLLPSLAKDVDLGTANGAEISASLSLLDEGLSRFNDRPKLAATSSALAQQLHGWAESLSAKQLTPGQVRGVMARAATAWESDNDRWDDAAQRYLALVALRIQLESPAAGKSPAGKTRLKEQLEQIRRKLQFPAGFDSPHVQSPEGGVPPATATPSVGEMFRQVNDLLK